MQVCFASPWIFSLLKKPPPVIEGGVQPNSKSRGPLELRFFLSFFLEKAQRLCGVLQAQLENPSSENKSVSRWISSPFMLFAAVHQEFKSNMLFRLWRAFHTSLLESVQLNPESEALLRLLAPRRQGKHCHVSSKGNILQLQGLLVWPEGNISTKSNYPYWLWGNKRLN